MAKLFSLPPHVHMVKIITSREPRGEDPIDWNAFERQHSLNFFRLADILLAIFLDGMH